MRRVNSQSKCNSKCCCRGCLDNLRICLLADGSTCPCCPLRGGLPYLLPANRAFSLLSCPHPPAPFPGGEGGDFLFSYARGFAPCIPEGWAGRGTGFACGKPVFSALNRALAPAGAAGIRVKKPATPWGYLYGRDCKCRRRLNAGDARGEAPCIKKPWSPPSPSGKGGGGRQGRRATKKARPPAGYSGGKVGKRPTGQAPRHLSGRVSCPPKKRPRPTFLLSPLASSARM